MKPAERDLIVKILTLLCEVSTSSLRAVPILFRPAGVQAKLDEMSELLAQLKARKDKL